MTPTGQGPGPVFGHSMVYDSTGNRMLVYGGMASDSSTETSGNVWTLDLSNAEPNQWDWSAIQTTGEAPSSRALHEAFLRPDNSLCTNFGQNRNPETGGALLNDFYCLTNANGLDPGTVSVWIPMVWKPATP